MIDLESLVRNETPRSLRLAKKFARLVEPTRGFLIFGALWFLVALFFAAIGLSLGITFASLLGHQPGSAASSSLSNWFGFGLFIFSWVPYVLWTIRKRSRARALIVEGEIIKGYAENKASDTAIQVAAQLGSFALGGFGLNRTFHRVQFQANGITYSMHCPLRASHGDALEAIILFRAKSKYALTFDHQGNAIVGRPRVKRGQRRRREHLKTGRDLAE